MKEIQLTHGFVTLVDDEDFEILKWFKWGVHKSRNTYYARTFKKNPNRKLKQKTIIMHRLIMNPPNDMQIDHINHNGLDNRKENLRIVTHRENHLNRIKNAILPGAFKTPCNNYCSKIRINGKQIRLGTFSTAELASNAYMKEFNKIVK